MTQSKMTFLLERLQTLQNLANWPNANVPVTALVTEYIPELCKVPYDYLFRDDAKAMAECTLLVQDYLKLDILTANMDVYNFEAEAMGAKIKFFPDHCPDFDRSDYFIKDAADLDKIRFGGLDQGRFPYLIEYCKVQRELDKLNMPGMRLMDTAFFGTAMLEGDERKRFEDFIIWSNGRFLCIDPDAASLGADYARTVATERMTALQTGISATYLEFEPIDNITALVRDYVLQAKAGPTPAIFFFNNISPNTAEEKIQAAVWAAKVYGAPGADDKTPYQMPEFLSFEEFLKYKLKNNPEEYTFEWLKKSAYSYLL